MSDEMITIWCDGSSLSNPGFAGIGAYFLKEEKPIAEISVFVGKKSNNAAEYLAVFYGMKFAIEKLNSRHLEIHSDSLLVINQIQGNYNINNPDLKKLNNRVLLLARNLKEWTILYHHWADSQPPHRLAQQAARSQRDYVNIFPSEVVK